MTRNTFAFILEILRPQLEKEEGTSGRPSKIAEQQFMVALWCLATPDSYRYKNINNITGIKL